MVALLATVVAMTTLSVSALEERVEEAIEKLDASAYTLGRLDPARWTPYDRFALHDEEQPGATRHLGFLAWVDDSDALPDRQQSPGTCLTRSRLIVGFTFGLRAGETRGDLRRAWDAAGDLARAVCALGGPAQPDLQIVLTSPGRSPVLTEDNSWVGMQVEFDALHEIDLTPPPPEEP